MIDALLEAYALKELDRQGWLRVGRAQPESVAAHSWGVALLVLLLLPEELDQARALRYAIVHDLAECRVGDLVPADGVDPAEKHRREAEALADLARSLPRGEQLHAIWSAYEAQADPEARFVRQLDRLDMALQARRYATQGLSTEEFLRSADRQIHAASLRSILAEIQ